MTASVLIVDDDPLQRQMLNRLLSRKLELEAQEAENGLAALKILRSGAGKSLQIVIMDLNMPVMDGMEALKIIKEEAPGLPVIMLTGSQDVEHAVKLMKLGATDYLTKPFESERMIVTVRNAMKIATLSREVNRLQAQREGHLRLDHLIGFETGLSEIIKTAMRGASSDIPVLVTGETGVGKEIFARALHGQSSRSGRVFVALNCGAIPAQLIESTLFGHEKGSFTGAIDKTIGKFREAEGGTLFLDEVGELPLDAQVKLLRVLQEKEVEPVGASRSVSVNVRVISATNRDLEAAVRQGLFREDLYFRLNVLGLHIPPLRERPQDIDALAQHFLDRLSVREGHDLKSIHPDALKMLEQHAWPGNVRELENALYRACVMADGPILEGRHFDLSSHRAVSESSPDSNSPQHAYSSALLELTDRQGLTKTMQEIEHAAMTKILELHHGNITQAARALGMAKSTFYRKLQENAPLGKP
jgi:DNA-binding NtrC family response regulator